MTEKVKAILIACIAIVHMLFFALWYANEANVLNQPIVKIMVKPTPYDPRDLLSGQYMRLNFTFNNLRGEWATSVVGSQIPDSKTIWVVLHKVKGFYEPKRASLTKPVTLQEGEVVIKGTRKKTRRALYGIEKYFVPERTKEPSPDDMTVELDVYKNGSVRISRVFVLDKLWP